MKTKGTNKEITPGKPCPRPKCQNFPCVTFTSDMGRTIFAPLLKECTQRDNVDSDGETFKDAEEQDNSMNATVAMDADALRTQIETNEMEKQADPEDDPMNKMMI